MQPTKTKNKEDKEDRTVHLLRESNKPFVLIRMDKDTIMQDSKIMVNYNIFPQMAILLMSSGIQQIQKGKIGGDKKL